MDINCLVCGADNPAGAATCRACGAALSGDPTRYVSALRPGTQLQQGHYAVGRVLGQGGFGITYLGSDSQARRVVAIKEFFPHGSTRHGLNVHPPGSISQTNYQTARTKFLDEARILAHFQHPGIVDVYGSFQANNTAYMVMEYIRGRSLLDLLEERGPLPEREAVGYIVRVGLALEIVHEASLLHRDLKPDNIMLADDGRIVLIDFGTARTFAAGKTGRMTTMLTPGYAPLEQYGQQVRFGPFTDVYALGATLYHVVTGKMPTDATDRVTGVPLPAPNEVNPDVSSAVSSAILWAMEIRVDRRPQTATELVRALQEATTITQPIPIPAFPPPVEPFLPPPAPPAPDASYYEPAAPFTTSEPVYVEAVGHDLHWPERCACCFEPADSSYTVSHTGGDGPFYLFEETRGWDVTYCSTCLEHIRLQSNAPGLGKLAAGTILGSLVGGPVGLLLGLGGAAASLFGTAQHVNQLQSAMRPTCAAIGPAVEYRGWDRDTHSFTFLNSRYAEAFARQNSAHVVA